MDSDRIKVYELFALLISGGWRLMHGPCGRGNGRPRPGAIAFQNGTPVPKEDPDAWRTNVTHETMAIEAPHQKFAHANWSIESVGTSLLARSRERGCESSESPSVQMQTALQVTFGLPSAAVVSSRETERRPPPAASCGTGRGVGAVGALHGPPAYAHSLPKASTPALPAECLLPMCQLRFLQKRSQRSAQDMPR